MATGPRNRTPPLLEQVHGLIERTYDHRTGLDSLAPYLIGDEGYRRLAARRRIVRRVGSAPAPGAERAQVLVRSPSSGGVKACLYFPDRLIRSLEERPPAAGLDGGNVDDFAGFVEEIDHLLLLAVRVRDDQATSLLELELHANVTKELVVRHFLARRARLTRLPPEAVAWARYHLFGKQRYRDADPAVARRYRDASRFALRYLRRLEDLPPPQRIADLRRFSRMTHHEKLRLIGGTD